ncbi:MAG: T9SS type A sorting domain-containing protein [Rhodothermales bacterium]
MRHISTTLLATALLFLVALPASAQPDRNGEDVIWARDVAGATITFDGNLDEPVWAQAEKIMLQWDGGQPGTNQFIDGTWTPLEPTDATNATVSLLRDGNTLWLGVDVPDKSVGGASGLWKIDGLVVNILDRVRLIDDRASSTDANFFSGGRTEFIYSWWNSVDTTDATTMYDDGTLVGSGRPMPGIAPRFNGFYGNSSVVGRDSMKIAVWDARTVVDGIANDDTNGDDVGYSIEMKFDMTALGYDFTQAEGDKAPWNVALRDQDYSWPLNGDMAINTCTYWQNPWGNNFDYGVGYIMGSPDVTVNSGAVPEVTDAEFTVPNGSLFDDPDVDGNLDEPVWDRVDPQFYVQYKPAQDSLNMNPGLAKYWMNYYRPDLNGNTAIVVDPSIARLKMFYKGNMLYVGVDVEDQAISGATAEGGRDGLYLFLADHDSVNATGLQTGVKYTHRFDFRMDSSGAVVMESEAKDIHDADPTALNAAIGYKGASTVADPTDVDEGYQIEIAIDLTKVLSYPDLTAAKSESIGDRALYVAMNFQDGDFLEAETDSYEMRTWILTERGFGLGASLYGYLDPNTVIGTAVENDVAEVPEMIQLYGSYPNPFNPSTRISYAIPSSGEVTVQVFSILGRKVAELEPGLQAAGRHDVTFQANGLTSGVYFYRIALKSDGNVSLSRADRLVLVK